MFRYLNPSKLTTNNQKASVFYYSGADAAGMQRRLKEDNTFLEINPNTVRKVIIMVGTNNVEKVYYGAVSIGFVTKILLFLAQNQFFIYISLNFDPIPFKF